MIGEDRAQAPRWVGAFLAVTALHAAPLLVAAYWLGPVVVRQVAEPAILIDMAPLAAPPSPSEQPPGPRQIKAEPPRVMTPEVDGAPLARNPAVALPLRVPEPPRQETPPAPQTTALPVRTAPPAPAPSSAATTWQGLLLGQLNKAKRYPVLAQSRRQQGAPWIRFVIDRDGRVLSSRLERSSGFSVLDQEAVALPRRAQPLPRPPVDVPGQAIELVVPVEFFLR